MSARLVVQDELAGDVAICLGAHDGDSALRRTSRNGTSRSGAASFGMPSSRSLIMFRCISLEPPATLLAWRDKYCVE